MKLAILSRNSKLYSTRRLVEAARVLLDHGADRLATGDRDEEECDKHRDELERVDGAPAG